MGVYKRGEIWWYHFTFAGRRVQKSAKTSSKRVAKDAERKRRRELEEGFNGLDPRRDRIRTIAGLAEEYLNEYRSKHANCNFVEHAIKPVVRLLGDKMVIEIDVQVVQEYQRTRLAEKRSAVTINGEVALLTRLMKKKQGAVLRALLNEESVILPVTEAPPGKAFTVQEKDALMREAERSPSKLLFPALVLAQNAGMRDGEIRRTRWSQIDFAKRILTVGSSKTVAGQGRTIPLNGELLDVITRHAQWYAEKFGELRPDWYVFPAGWSSGRMDPTRHVSSFGGPWKAIREKTGIIGRWHDNRHTLVTELCESGAGDETIMSIAGHVSKKMLRHYSHIRVEAKRNALDEVLKRRQDSRDLQAAQKEAEQSKDSAYAVN